MQTDDPLAGSHPNRLGTTATRADAAGGAWILHGIASGLIGAASARGMPLDVVDIGEPAIAALYDRRLVLVRPDGYVAWRADAGPGDPLAVIDMVRGARPAP